MQVRDENPTKCVIRKHIVETFPFTLENFAVQRLEDMKSDV